MATDAKEITVESSPTDILASMTPIERKTWRETGNVPEPKEKAATAAAPPAKKDSDKAEDAAAPPAAKTEVAEKVAASAPAKDELSVSRGKNAVTRIPELLSEIKRLNAELETARKVPAAAPAKKEEAIAKPHRNDLDEKTGQPKYATDDEFLDARDKYVADMTSKQTRADIAKEEGERRVAEQNRLIRDKYLKALTIAREAHSDFDKVCEVDDKGAFQNAELKKIKGGASLDRFCLDTARGGDILYYLASHPGEVERIQAIDSLDEITEALVDLKKKSLAEASAKVEEVKTESSQKSVTKAPAPAADVGGRATAPRDEEEAALNAGEFRRYMKAANEAEFRTKKKAS
jgi:hypothetical protein